MGVVISSWTHVSNGGVHVAPDFVFFYHDLRFSLMDSPRDLRRGTWYKLKLATPSQVPRLGPRGSRRFHEEHPCRFRSLLGYDSDEVNLEIRRESIEWNVRSPVCWQGSSLTSFEDCPSMGKISRRARPVPP